MSTIPRPYFARVILQRPVAEKKGNILIPESLRYKHSDNVGTVVAVGPTADPSIRVGALVKIGKAAGAWEKIPGSDDEFFICQDEDLLVEIVEV